MKIISEQLIRSLDILPSTCVKWVYDSFSMKKDAQLPVKNSVHPDDGEFFTSMPCLLPPPIRTNVKGVNNQFKRQYFGVKVVHRLLKAVPSLGSDLMLYDSEKGELLALVDADWITTMRTGAVAAISSKVLRKKDAKTYGFIGLGNTARATLLCILEQEPNRHFNVQLARYKNQAEKFIERFAAYPNVSFDIVDSVVEMAHGVDVFISCITNAQELLVPDEKVFQSGVTVIPVHMRGLQNCDVTFDRVFGDDTAHVQGFKTFHQWKDFNEIGEVLAGRDPGRCSDEQRIIDYNYGLGLHDVVFAAKIYELLEDIKIPEVLIVKEKEKFWV
ncbi:MAG: ornithine cyclodeaminase [Bacteroidaceae bacterium]|nr:ornithine cyclodeaminase [Bacteroidaceae bacterium]